MPPSVYLAVAIGGALGALGRYSLSTWITSRSVGEFPLGTLVVNIIGCFLLGILFALGEKTLSPQFGFC